MQRLASTPAPPDSVSFRLSKEVAAELAAKAARAGVSPNLLARDLMIAALLKPADHQQRILENILMELGRVRSALSATNGQKQNGELSGRLLTEIHKMLDAYFERYEGRSAENLDTLRSEIAEVLCDLPQIRRLNASLGTSVNLLLSNAGKVPREQAAAWVEQTFSP
jgi:hypothetical protein